MNDHAMSGALDSASLGVIEGRIHEARWEGFEPPAA
jgi:hypothetical protein